MVPLLILPVRSFETYGSTRLRLLTSIQGKGLANPTALLLSSMMMLRFVIYAHLR
jgi:hypothetical protein